MKNWLTVKEAAARVDRSERTLWRWQEAGVLTILYDRVIEEQLLAADLHMRSKRGRPKKKRNTL